MRPAPRVVSDTVATVRDRQLRRDIRRVRASLRRLYLLNPSATFAPILGRPWGHQVELWCQLVSWSTRRRDESTRVALRHRVGQWGRRGAASAPTGEADRWGYAARELDTVLLLGDCPDWGLLRDALEHLADPDVLRAMQLRGSLLPGAAPISLVTVTEAYQLTEQVRAAGMVEVWLALLADHPGRSAVELADTAVLLAHPRRSPPPG